MDLKLSLSNGETGGEGRGSEDRVEKEWRDDRDVAGVDSPSPSGIASPEEYCKQV